MPQVPIYQVRWSSREAFVRDVVDSLQALGLNQQSAILLTAHVALSTGWGKSADNYRMAGIKATSEDQDYTVVSGFEMVNGQRVDSMMKWRSYNTLLDGLQAVVGLLKAPRYTEALRLLLAGDEGYFAEVGRAGWYTADPEGTAAEMKSRLKEIRRIMGLPTQTVSGIWAVILAVGGGWLGWWIMKRFSR